LANRISGWRSPQNAGDSVAEEAKDAERHDPNHARGQLDRNEITGRDQSERKQSVI
jgi:hypothetical protein